MAEEGKSDTRKEVSVRMGFEVEICNPSDPAACGI